MNAKRVLTYVAILFVLFFVLTSPTSAGSAVTSGWHLVVTAAHQFANFLKSLGK